MLTEKEPTGESVLEIHEEFLKHVEAGSAKIKTLSMVTIVVAALLAASYVYEVALAYAGSQQQVTVNLRDPALVSVELVLTALALVWLYVGVNDYRFVARLSKSIAKARALEEGIEREIEG